MTYSYHIFYFPFKWEIKNLENHAFSEQVNLNRIQYAILSKWKRSPKPEVLERVDLYNEKNYYYKFVHHILYDDVNSDSDLIRHFEREELQDPNREIYYEIKKKGRNNPYRLKVDAMNINLYSTGVGFLSFYLKNEDENQKDPEDILSINQYGRRILPPFFGDITKRIEISEYITIKGLDGTDANYKETFNNYTTDDYWKPANFINSLINELATNITIEPIIDDRMFVASWYKNDKLSNYSVDNLDSFMNSDKTYSSFWYRYLFVDGDNLTCQNDQMKKDLLEKHTYPRWQKWHSLYGVSKYSLVYLADDTVPPFLLTYFQTIYARMVELVLVQRASMLRFSGEITKVSRLSNQEAETVSNRISSLYKEYIRFVNQIYFREVTAQDQGIELYTKLQDCLRMGEYIEDLDGEMEELHQYVSLMEDRERNKKATLLNNIAILFLPVTVLTGFFGMNKLDDVIGKTNGGIIIQSILLIIGIVCAICVIYKRKQKL